MKTTKSTKADKSKVELQQERQQVTQHILDLTESRLAEPYTDRRLDRDYEIIELLNGSKISPFDLKKRFIAEIAQPWEVFFTKEFYSEVFRKNGWPIPEGGISEKPHIVAQWTNEVIYLRFTKEILDELRRKNPYMTGIWLRREKHHQWLSDAGREKLRVFIQDAIDGMKACTGTWYDFQLAHAKKYNLPCQLKMAIDAQR